MLRWTFLLTAFVFILQTKLGRAESFECKSADGYEAGHLYLRPLPEANRFTLQIVMTTGEQDKVLGSFKLPTDQQYWVEAEVSCLNPKSLLVSCSFLQRQEIIFRGMTDKKIHTRVVEHGSLNTFLVQEEAAAGASVYRRADLTIAGTDSGFFLGSYLYGGNAPKNTVGSNGCGVFN